ncbi:MAG: hypothetical protein ACRC67_03900 [Inquilinus sp.]|uniref:hypothetical protein n=1 Tax=Inquilinus sp. TaxID=1932117 RepID=UPI003F3E4810
MNFEQIAREHRLLDAAYRRIDPASPDHGDGYGAAQKAHGDLWRADPGHDPMDVARYGIAIIDAERVNLANDDGTAEPDRWDEYGMCYATVMRHRVLFSRIVAALGGGGDVVPLHGRTPE